MLALFYFCPRLFGNVFDKGFLCDRQIRNCYEDEYVRSLEFTVFNRKSMGNEKSLISRDKVVFEYPLSTTSVPMIWETVATAPGLESWFADRIESAGKVFVFFWGKNESRKAEMINSRQNNYVRFHWLDDVPGTYFEFKIVRNELTGSFSLEITDFVDSDDKEDSKNLWDTSVDSLRRCGL